MPKRPLCKVKKTSKRTNVQVAKILKEVRKSLLACQVALEWVGGQQTDLSRRVEQAAEDIDLVLAMVATQSGP